MLKRVINLSQTTVKEIMVPRTDVDFLTIADSEKELLEKIKESGHSRFPVYEDSIDNVVGVLYVKDIIENLSRKEPLDMKKIVRRPFLSPKVKTTS